MGTISLHTQKLPSTPKSIEMAGKKGYKRLRGGSTDNTLRNHLMNDVTYITTTHAMMVNESQKQLYPILKKKHNPAKCIIIIEVQPLPMKASVNGGKIN